VKLKRRHKPFNRTVAEVELKLEALQRARVSLEQVANDFYNLFRMFGIGYSEFVDIWFKAAEKVYEGGNKPDVRDSDTGRRGQESSKRSPF